MLKTLCSAENTSGIAKVGYLFAFFGSGTTCRCCLGSRVLFAFFLGLAMAFVALYSVMLCGAIIITFIGTCLMFFVLWRLAEQEKQEQEDEYEYVDDEYEGTPLLPDTNETNFNDEESEGPNGLYYGIDR